VTLDEYLDRLMSIMNDETATDAERDAAAKAAAPYFHEELTMEVSNTQWAIYLSRCVVTSVYPPGNGGLISGPAHMVSEQA
jgi:hypothetical protein